MKSLIFALVVLVCTVSSVNGQSYEYETARTVWVPQVQTQRFRATPYQTWRQSWLFPNMYWRSNHVMVQPIQ